MLPWTLLNVTTSLTASGLIYPTVDGTAGQVLTTNGAGSLSFSSSSISASYAITASYAIQALSSSYVVPSATNAFVQGGNSFGTTALLGTNDNQSLAFETNGSTKMFISSSGNVGIGTTAPDRKLHVKDSTIVITKLEGTNQGSLLDLVNTNASQLYNGLRFTQGTTSKMAITHIADGTTKGYVQIGNGWAAGSEILVVDGRTLNVGIGTTNPSQKLEVAGNISGSGYLKVRWSTNWIISTTCWIS
jgi:trimeric autotransporter adhesin